MTPLAAYLLLFIAVGAGFILVHLVLGALIRPSRPDAEKDTIYECGEPTIGTAWVQFDLRYYVVALLFVIFDVEVAFFFPWAEVFGKANAVANLPEPKSVDDYHRAANAVLDLDVSPAGATGAARIERRKWQALRDMTPEAYAAYEALSKEQRIKLRDLPRQVLPLLKGVPKEAYPVFKAEAGRLAPELKRVEEGRRAAVEDLKAALREKGAAGPLLDTLSTESEDKLQSVPLGQMTNTDAKHRLADLLSGASLGPGQPVRGMPPVRPELPALDAKANELNKALAPKVIEARNAVRAALNVDGVSPQTREQLPEVLTQGAMETLGSFDAELISVVNSGKLSDELLQVLSDERGDQGPLPRVKREAWWLAALALVEVLVFFGVLLVGFAYLWRRGDIEWVRSTAAEQPEKAPVVEKPVVQQTAPTSGA